ncbi:Peroxidase [Musa troglodytarum]|uniref:Peroxidase n=1 Tax=Musa troglodytarum TaxID=320322 RepID=A0A9E7GI25_9LILI|nr:Peroxidase [Musa troglodytarum]
MAALSSSLLLLAAHFLTASFALELNFYRNSCPGAELIVKRVVQKHFQQDPSVSAGLVRLHFHDCFVRGCDASVLVDSTDYNIAEKEAPPNLTLRAFDVIDDIKAEVEKECSGVVSCADILALAARDGVALSGGEDYPLPTGRRDGTVSLMEDAHFPGPSFSVQAALAAFQTINLDLVDLTTLLDSLGGRSSASSHVMCTALMADESAPSSENSRQHRRSFTRNKKLTFRGSKKRWSSLMFLEPSRLGWLIVVGAHSIGLCHCGFFIDRLYNFRGSGLADPHIDPGLLDTLRHECPFEVVEIKNVSKDPKVFMNQAAAASSSSSSPFTLDASFYRGLLDYRAVLRLDQNLAFTDLTSSLAASYVGDPKLFLAQFSKSMIKLGSVGVLTGRDGEIRSNCRSINNGI